MDEDWAPLIDQPEPDALVAEEYDPSWQATFKWGVSGTDGRTDVWRTHGGGLDGMPTHRGELKTLWGRDPQVREGDQLGMAQYIPAERKLDGTLVAPPVVLVHPYYGLPMPPSVVDWFEQQFPNTVVRQAVATNDMKGRPVKLAEWAPTFKLADTIRWVWNQRDGVLVWLCDDHGQPTHDQKVQAEWGRPIGKDDYLGYADFEGATLKIDPIRFSTPAQGIAQVKAELSKLYPDKHVVSDQDLAEQYGVEFHGDPGKIGRRMAAAEWAQKTFEVLSYDPLGGSESDSQPHVRKSGLRVPSTPNTGKPDAFFTLPRFFTAAVNKARRVKKAEFDFSREPQVRRTIVHSYPWDDPEDYENYNRDEYDLHDEEDPIQAAADWLYDKGLTEYSSSPSFVPHGWYSDPDGSYESAKPEGFNEDEQRAIWAAIRAGDEAWRIPNAPPLGHPDDWTAKTKKAGADMSGAMVALFIPEEAGKKLKVKGGEDLDMLHITLLYFQDKYADRDDWDEVAKVVEQVANQTPKMTGKVNGYGVFNNDEDVLWAVPSIQGLASLREKLLQACEDAGFPVSKTYDWAPHITLKYNFKGKMPRIDEPVELDIPELTFAHGNNRDDFKLEGHFEKEAGGWGAQEWSGWQGTHRFVTDGKEVLTDPETGEIGADAGHDLDTKFRQFYPDSMHLVHGWAVPTKDEMGYGIYAPHAGWGHPDEPGLHEIVNVLDKHFGKPTHFIESDNALYDKDRYTIYPTADAFA